MVYKVIGALLILVSAGCACTAVIVIEKKHLEQLGAVLALIAFIETQIDNFNLPVPEILKRADKKLLSVCGFDENDLLSFDTLKESSDLLLDGKEKAVLFEFADTLGHAYRENQLASCRYARGELQKMYTERKNNFSGKTRLTLTVGICAALALIIFML